MKKKFLGLAAAAVLAASSAAMALPVVFTTTGAFSNLSGGTTSVASGVTNNGITVTYTAGGDSLSLDPLGPTFSGADFGFFTVAGAPLSGNSASLVADFTLTVNQTQPGPGGSQSFGVGSISGQIFIGASQSYVQFTSPLALNFVSPTVATTYTIVSADNNTPGRVNLKAPGNNTTIQGQVSIAAVPLPASAWGGMGLFAALGAVQLRRKLKA